MMTRTQSFEVVETFDMFEAFETFETFDSFETFEAFVAFGAFETFMAAETFGGVIVPGARRIPRGARTGAFRRRCGRDASGTVRTALSSVRWRRRPLRSRPRRSSAPRRNLARGPRTA